MSDSYDIADLSMAYNQGHNDAWGGKPPRPAPKGIISDRKHQKYREGYNHGTTARFYYNAGYQAGKEINAY